MSDKANPRPPQATLLGGALMVGSIFIVLFAFDRMASLGSIEAQEEAQRFVDSVGRDVGLTADGWQSVQRVLCVIAGGLGVLTSFLGWRVLQRDRRARLMLSVLAPFGLVAGLSVAGFVPAIMAVAVVMLWRPPTRDWLEHRTPARHPALAAVGGAPASASPPTSATPGTPEPPVGAAPAATPAVPQYAPPVPAYGAPAYGAPAAAPNARPGTVLAAALITIITSVLVAVVAAVGLLAMVADRAGVEREIDAEVARQPSYQDLDLDSGVVVDVLLAVLVVLLVWAALAIVLAVLTLRGSNGARIALVVSAFAASLVSLLGVLVVVPLLVGAACIAVAVLLLRRDAATWCATRKASPRP